MSPNLLPSVILISLSVWEQKKSSMTSSIFYVLEADVGLSPYAGNKDFIIKSFVPWAEKDAWIAANPTATALTYETDVIVQFASLVEKQRNPEGNLVYAPTFFQAEQSWRSKGVYFTVAGNSEGIYDYEIASELLIQGAEFFVNSDVSGNSADFSIIDKNNILGYHTMMGLPLGTPIELTKFVETNYFPAGLFVSERKAPTASRVYAGLFVRVKYVNNSANTAQVGVNYVWFVA